MAKYHHLKGVELQPWYSIDIERDEKVGVKRVFFNSTIHIQKRTGFTFCFDINISDDEILHDHNLARAIWNSYGAVGMPEMIYKV